MNLKERIDFLRKELTEHNHSYYVLDTPKVSDFEFDCLMKELQDLENNNPEFYDKNSPTQRVGAPPSKSFEEVIHNNQMLSLSNVFNEQELINWKERCEKYISRDINGFVFEELTPLALSEKIQNIFSGGKLQVVKEELLVQNDAKLDEWSIFADDFMHFISTEKSKK